MFGTATQLGKAALLLLPAFVSSTPLQTFQYNATESVVTGFPPCDALISAGLGDRLLLATSDAYEPRVQSWSSANARLRPWCFFQPHNTQEVSLAVSTLAQTGQGAGNWHIAVRSGGHGNREFSNIADGVTIDLGMMNFSSYDPTRNVVQVQPGGHWKDVYSNLLHTANVTVTGGRDGDVGVGGFLLGGGNSYYSGRNGFGCDTVVNYEVVLANGTVIDVNAHENPDLWTALKGGGLNYGIVTRFDLEAMPAVDLAYGQSVYSPNYSDSIIEAVVDFTNALPESADDAMFSIWTHGMLDNDGVKLLVVRVNTRGNLNTTGFDEFNDIPSLTSSWRHESLADAANGSQLQAGMKNTAKTLTVLNAPPILRKSASLHADLVARLTSRLGAENYTTGVILQPLPTHLATIGKRQGGNVLGLDRIPSNAILWTAGVGIKNGDDAALALAQAELSAMTNKLEAFAKQEGVANGWIYMNYADGSQDSLGSYGPENVEFMKEVAKKYDPNGFWQERVPGGFKLARVTG